MYVSVCGCATEQVATEQVEIKREWRREGGWGGRKGGMQEE
jgi:hypothetical protein